MMHDYQDKLKLEQFRFFIQAQLSILKNIKAGPAKELFYGPRCLTGEPAWNRWLIWNRYAKAQKTERTIINVENFDHDLIKTKAILENKIRPLNKETLMEAMNSGQLFRLAMLKAISPIFLSVCPIVKNYIEQHPKIKETYNIKLNDFVSNETTSKYQELFGVLI